MSEENCDFCKKKFNYIEAEDKNYNPLVPISGRSVVVDDKGQIFPLYAVPSDKRRLIDKKFIKKACSTCYIAE